jgi:ribonuclease P protein component
LAIATRTLGNSVLRNRVKRIARESFRLHQYSLPSIDVTIAAREAARRASSRDLFASLEQHWQAIAKRW